jgi:hypothetical protein
MSNHTPVTCAVLAVGDTAWPAFRMIMSNRGAAVVVQGWIPGKDAALTGPD